MEVTLQQTLKQLQSNPVSSMYQVVKLIPDGTREFVLEHGHYNKLIIECPIQEQNPTIDIFYRKDSISTHFHVDVPLLAYEYQAHNDRSIYFIDLGSVYLGNGADLKVSFSDNFTGDIKVFQVTENLTPPYFNFLQYTNKLSETYKGLVSAYFYQENRNMYSIKSVAMSGVNEILSVDLSIISLAKKTPRNILPVYKTRTGVPEDVTLELKQVQPNPQN